MKEILTNYDFFYEIKGIKKNIILSIDIKKTLIENIILIIGIVPFLKNNSFIKYKINSNEVNKIFKFIFNHKHLKNKIFIIDKKDILSIKRNFESLVDNIWESIPQKKILDNIRYIINNFYDSSCSNQFEESLNKNYDYYISKNIKFLSKEDFEDLISKSYKIFIILQLENIGIYKKKECSGEGSFASVRI
jgi:hypothetical protein